MFYFPAETEAKSMNEKYDKKGPKSKRLLQEWYLLQCTVLSLNLQVSWGLSMLSLHVRFMPVWLLSAYSSFLPQSKYMWWTSANSSACTVPRAQSCDRLKAPTPYVPEIDTWLRKVIIGPCRLLFFYYHVCCCTLSCQNRTGSAHAPASSPGNTRCLRTILWNSTLKLMGYICLADISSCPARHSIAKRSIEFMMRSW